MKTKRLFLIGAGDFGREMESWLPLLPGFNEEWSLVGFLDDNPDALAQYPSDLAIIGKPLDYKFQEGDYALMCITNPVVKKNLALQLKHRVQFFTYIAPNAIIAKFSKVLTGSIICPNSIIATNTIIGEFVTVNSGTQIGHDCHVGAYSSLMASVDLGGHVNLGEGVFIGTNATIIPQKSVADGIFIGAGAIVIKSLKKTGTYFGNPATLIL